MNNRQKTEGNRASKNTSSKTTSLAEIRKSIQEKKSASNRKRLRIICFIGLFLSLLVFFAMLFFNYGLEREGGSAGAGRSGSFARELRAYDRLDLPKQVLSGENPDRIEKQIMKLQKQGRTAEDRLSVLKRRRALALIDKRYLGSYQKAAQEAADIYSYSAPIAAVAADAIILGGHPFSADNRDMLRKYTARLSQTRFSTLELGAHILSGNFESPSQAAAAGLERLISAEKLLSNEFSGLSPEERRNLQINEFLLLAAKGDVPDATVKLSALLDEAGINNNITRMGAEFFYDHRNLIRAGELFSGINDMERAADSLVLSGEIEAARNIWLTLASPGNYRSYYNLAASSPNNEEKLSWLEKLLVQSFRNDNNHRTYGIICYTRLKETEQSIQILDEFKSEALPDLELFRRRLETLPPTRAAAEVWMLINRHNEEEILYEWAAWYFDHQKLYNETERVLKEAGRKGITAPWTELYKGLALMRNGKIHEGETVLKDAEAAQEYKRSGEWRFPANLGRIQENRRAISAALDYYEKASQIASDWHFSDNAGRAMLQVRISRCLEALGRSREAARALEHAAELDPENLIVRRELRRIENR